MNCNNTKNSIVLILLAISIGPELLYQIFGISTLGWWWKIVWHWPRPLPIYMTNLTQFFFIFLAVCALASVLYWKLSKSLLKICCLVLSYQIIDYFLSDYIAFYYARWFGPPSMLTFFMRWPLWQALTFSGGTILIIWLLCWFALRQRILSAPNNSGRSHRPKIVLAAIVAILLLGLYIHKSMIWGKTGKVIDTGGNPICGAYIIYGYEGINVKLRGFNDTYYIPGTILLTDKNGLFKIPFRFCAYFPLMQSPANLSVLCIYDSNTHSTGELKSDGTVVFRNVTGNANDWYGSIQHLAGAIEFHGIGMVGTSIDETFEDEYGIEDENSLSISHCWESPLAKRMELLRHLISEYNQFQNAYGDQIFIPSPEQKKGGIGYGKKDETWNYRLEHEFHYRLPSWKAVFEEWKHPSHRKKNECTDN